jgi:nucleotide-binding universal stress UspA family protein
VVAHAEVVEWPPALVLTVASRTAGLLVVGARGRGGFDELLLGSVSDQCIQYAHCPVVVVSEDPDHDTPLEAGSRIVVGMDGSLGSTRALRWSLEEAEVRSASVEAIYAWQYPPIGSFLLGPAEGFEMAGREIADAATEYGGTWAPDVPFAAMPRFGATVPTLLDASNGAGLLVVGARGHGGFADALLGSVAHQCARHAGCPVVVVRPATDSATGPVVTGRASERSGTPGGGPADDRTFGPTGDPTGSVPLTLQPRARSRHDKRRRTP